MNVLGWREWVALPELGVLRLKCKVDTGARTSALHAWYVEPFDDVDGGRRVRFGLHPHQNDTDFSLDCVADIHDERDVTDSGGHTEKRIVICTPVVIGGRQWPIELTLTSRDTMRFRMLLGRTAISGLYLVDPESSFQAGEPGN